MATFLSVDFMVKILVALQWNISYVGLHGKDPCRPSRKYFLCWTSWYISLSTLEAIFLTIDFTVKIISAPPGNIYYVGLHGEDPGRPIKLYK